MKSRKQKSGTFNLPHRLLAMFLVFVLSIYLLGMAVVVKLERSASREVRHMYQSQVSSLAEQLGEELERIQLQVNYVMTRPIVQYVELATPSIPFSEMYDSIRQVGSLMYALQNSSGLIREASIYLPQLGKIISADGTYRSPSAEDEEFLKQYRRCGARQLLTSANGQLYLMSDSIRISSDEQTALIRVTLSERSLSDWCRRFAENTQICLWAAREMPEPFFLSEGDENGGSQKFGDDLKGALETRDQPIRELETENCRVAGQEYQRMMCSVGDKQLWVAGYVRAEDLQGASAAFTVWQIVLTVFLVLEVGIFFYITHKLVAQPINRFMGQVQTLKEEGMLQLSQQPGNNMDFLYSAFLGLSEELKVSLEQAYSDKLMANQLEIKYLQAQINPHFLYNSFYHLYRMAKMEDNEGVAQMSQRLSAYYRYITRSDQNVVPLSMEYDNIRDYTEIQTIRFGDRITVELEPLPEGYAQLPVPRFVLQPLFENAYNHGVEKMSEGRIRLRFEEKPDALIILVENNGSCAEEELTALRAYLDCSDRDQKITALKNVKGRMQLLGGNLTVSRGELGGFCATLTLPGGKNNKEESYYADTSDRG